MIRSSWATDNALIWLQSLLYERFGKPLTLKRHGLGELELSFQDGKNYIRTELMSTMYLRSDSDLPYREWNASSEGWNYCYLPNLPLPGIAPTFHSRLIKKTSYGYKFDFDLFGLIFWVLNRVEEIGQGNLDKFKRFQGSQSHAFKHGYLERPFVDEWLFILRQALERIYPSVEFKRRSFRIEVSHDVDVPSRYGFLTAKRFIKSASVDVFMRGAMRQVIHAPISFIFTKNNIYKFDPANYFDWLMASSEARGIKSTFYFICGKSSGYKNMDGDYDHQHPAIINLMTKICGRGHLLGLHPSFDSFLSPQIIADEFQKLLKVTSENGLKQKRWGARMHYLRYNSSVTLKALDDAGLNYHSSMGYADLAGFRSGTSIEYPGFDFIGDRALKIRIQPLVAMESTIISSIYMGLGLTDASLEKFIQLKNASRSVSGDFSLLWHNNNLNNKAMRKMYLEVLDG